MPTGGSAVQREHRAAQKHLTNPPFDQRIFALAPVGGRNVSLKRGRLVSKEITGGLAGAATGARWTLNFLYNPSTIQVSHAVAMDQLAENEHSPFDVSDYTGDTLSSLQWSLLFDRTYETWDRAYANKPAGKYGVYSDIRALYGMFGMVPQNAIRGVDLITNPMKVAPVQVWFGGEGSLSYYGRIESMDVQYTHWTTKMIPNRAVVGLSMKIFPPKAVSYDTGTTNSKGGSKGKGVKKRTVPHSAHSAPPVRSS